MKRVLSVVLAIALMVTFAGSTLGAFITSPSITAAPVLADGSSANIAIVGYGDREQLPAEELSALGNAYAELVDCQDFEALIAGLAAVLQALDVAEEDLAVSDLFALTDASVVPLAGGKYSVRIKGIPENLVSVAARYGDNNWQALEYTTDGDCLVFSVDAFVPMAFLVNTNPKTPDTGDSALLYICIAAMAISAAALAVVIIKRKKAE